MLNGPLLGKLIIFAVPILLSGILQQMFNAADTAVVGRFAGSAALAAVGGNASTVSFLLNLFMGISNGSGVAAAIRIGEGREERVSDTVHTSLLFSLICGVFLMIFGQIVARPLLRMMSSPENVIDLATVYLRIYLAGAPFIMFYNFGAALLRSTGDTKRPLYCLIASGVVNVCLNVLFVVRYGLGTAGVALATTVSNALSAGLVCMLLCREKGLVRFQPSRLRLNLDELKMILKIGVPAGLQGTLFSFSNVCIQSGVNSFGSTIIAGSSVALNAEYMGYFAISGFGQAAMTFTGQNYGAKKFDRCKRILWLSMAAGFAAWAVTMSLMMLGRHQIIGLFTKDAEVAAAAELRMFCVLIYQGIAVSYEVSGSAMRGMGRSLVPAVITTFGSCFFRMFWIAAVVSRFHEYWVLLSVYKISWTLTGLSVLTAYFILFRRIVRTEGAAQ